MSSYGVYDFTINAGADFSRVFTWKDSGSPQTPIDLTGCTARMSLKRDYRETTARLSLTTENDGLALGGTTGTITVSIPNEDTSDLSGKYLYDLEIVHPDSTVTRLLGGTITVSPEVTK